MTQLDRTRRKPLVTRPWIGPLAAITVVFLAFSLPNYLTLDPATSLIDTRDDLPFHYPLLVTHIFLGAVVLLTACLQIWPWLRTKHRKVHRLSGRIYVAAAVPAGLCTLVIGPLSSFGLNQQMANTMLGVLWLATTITGFLMARNRRFAEHREWMIRSFALSFSIVASRFWGIGIGALFGPDNPSADPALLEQVAGTSAWMSWIVNLLIAEVWLIRTRAKKRARSSVPRRVAAPVV